MVRVDNKMMVRLGDKMFDLPVLELTWKPSTKIDINEDYMRELTILIPFDALEKVRSAARKRNTRVERLLTEIVTLIAKDDLFTAVLDDAEECEK
jgi:hypothetical protein